MRRRVLRQSAATVAKRSRRNHTATGGAPRSEHDADVSRSRHVRWHRLVGEPRKRSGKRRYDLAISERFSTGAGRRRLQHRPAKWASQSPWGTEIGATRISGMSKLGAKKILKAWSTLMSRVRKRGQVTDSGKRPFECFARSVPARFSNALPAACPDSRAAGGFLS